MTYILHVCHVCTRVHVCTTCVVQVPGIVLVNIQHVYRTHFYKIHNSDLFTTYTYYIHTFTVHRCTCHVYIYTNTTHYCLLPIVHTCMGTRVQVCMIILYYYRVLHPHQAPF